MQHQGDDDMRQRQCRRTAKRRWEKSIELVPGQARWYVLYFLGIRLAVTSIYIFGGPGGIDGMGHERVTFAQTPSL